MEGPGHTPFEQETNFSPYSEAPDTVWDTDLETNAVIDREVAEDSLAEEAMMHVAAIESDRPIEGEIEKSHEAKSDQAQGQPQQDPKQSRIRRIAGVITKLTSHPDPVPALEVSAVEAIPAAESDDVNEVPILSQLPKFDQPTTSLYRQAMLKGFVAAGVLLVIWAVASLLM